MVEIGQRLQQKSEALARKFPPLLVAAYRVADSVMMGLHGRRRPGSGETFWQFRRYEPSDSASLIDWRQSAKSEPIYVREQEWETSQSIWIWCDHSRSMEFSSRADIETKQERARLLALSFAVLLLRGGERVGLLGADATMLKGLGALPRMVQMLVSGLVDDEQKGLPEPRVLPRGSQVVLISDFIEPIEPLEDRIKWYSSRGQRGLLLQVLDPAEVSLPYTGRARFMGLEGEDDTVIAHVENVRVDYETRVSRHVENLMGLAHRFGWSFVQHKSDSPPERALSELYLSLSQEVE